MNKRLVIGAITLGSCLALAACAGPGTGAAGSASPSVTAPATTSIIATASATPTATVSPAATVSTPAVTTPGVVERQPAIVTSTRAAAAIRYLTVDYIQFLTGAEAERAAAARGDEVTNDYYIINDNPRLREFPVREGLRVRVVVRDDPDEPVVPEGYDLALADWLTAITGPRSDFFLANFYWITITDGTITGIEQQYLP